MSRNKPSSPPQDGHRARKRFGQNFLVDERVIERIVAAISPKAGEAVVEIGPGQGALTAVLLERCPNLQAVELDRDLLPRLQDRFQTYGDFKLHQADALKFDFATLATGPASLRVVGNLPYNISTPLMFHLLQNADLIADMHFMLQKEVVQRLAAGPGGKDYGRLSVMCGYYCEVEALFEVAPHCFSPQPKVDSAIVRLRPRRQHAVDCQNIALLEKVVTAAFGQRRKTLRNGLKSLFSAEQLDSLPIDLSRRAETLSVDDFVTISNLLSSSET